MAIAPYQPSEALAQAAVRNAFASSRSPQRLCLIPQSLHAFG